MTPIDRVLQAFPDAHREGDGWRAQCPIHEDAHPSLRISQGRDGTVLLKCRVCGKDRTKDILAARGLTFADLFNKADRVRATTPKANGVMPKPETVAVYVYENEHREPIAEKHRLQLPDGGKRFLQKRYGAEEWGLNGKELPLYRLPELLAAPYQWPIALCEGEKDADALRGLGLVATTNAEGATTWEARHSEALRRRRVYILEDNDEAGRQRTRILTKALSGIAAEIKIVSLPGLPEKGDVSVWLENGHTRDELIEIVKATPALTPPGERLDESAADLCGTEPEETPWLVPGFVAEAAVTELDGKVKLGKTSLALDMVRSLTTTGGKFLGLPCPMTSVVYVTEQGRPSFTKALRRAGLDRTSTLYPVFWLEHRHLSWPELVQFAVAKARRVGAKLVVVDTISKLAGIKQENEAGEMAAAVEPLQVIANQAGIAVLALRHDRKSGGEVGDSGRGNSQMTGDADIVVQLARPEGNHSRNRRLLNRVSRFDDETSILIERQDDSTFVSLGEPGDFAAEQVKLAILEALSTEEAIATPLLEEKLNGKDDKGKPKRLTGVQNRMLTELITEGAILRSGEGKAAHPYLYRRAKSVAPIRQSKGETDFRPTPPPEDAVTSTTFSTEKSVAPMPTLIGETDDPLVAAALRTFPGAKVL